MTSVGTDARPADPATLQALYRARFPPELAQRRRDVWQVICRHWLDRYVPPGGTVLDVGAGLCEFINAVTAGRRLAVDLLPDLRDRAAPGVEVFSCAAERLTTVIPAGTVDVAFLSNFLEHCTTRDAVLDVLREVRRALRPGGRILVLGPNFRHCSGTYFDFFDHCLPLTERAVAEALGLSGYAVEEVVAQTLPFSFRGALPSWPWLVRLYLRLRPAWRLFGAQYFLVARRPPPTGDEPPPA